MKLIDLVLIIIIAALAALAIRYMIRNKKAGKSFNGCSGNCSECAMQNCSKKTDHI